MIGRRGEITHIFLGFPIGWFFNLHLVTTSFVNMLEEKEMNILSAPLDAFDDVGVEEEVKSEDVGGNESEEIANEVYNASQPNGGAKRSANDTGNEDICLMN
jgi:hypothetical protein